MSQDIQLQLVYAAVASLADEIADMIADWFGRSVIDADHDLALAILARLVMPSRDQLSDPVDGHDADWCRDCQEGCGEAYGGACDCCKRAARCEEDEI